MAWWRWVKFCACLVMVSCAASPPTGTEVVVRVENDGRALVAQHLLFSWLECRSFLEQDRRVPASGELAPEAMPLASIIVRLDIGAPVRRGIMIKGVASGQTVSLGTAVVDISPGSVTTATVRLYALPDDTTFEGVPAALDWCPPPPTPDAGITDAAPRDAQAPDASVPVDALLGDTLPADASSSAGNAAPVVSVGPALFVARPGAELALPGMASDDGRPGPLTLTWSLVSGPGTVTFGSPAAAQTTAKFSAPGPYVVRLTAYDGELSAQADLTVNVLDLGTALAGLWHFDEGQGTTAADGSGGANHATLMGARWGEGRLGASSLDCSGQGGRAVVPDPADDRLDFGASDFTISAWVRTSRGRMSTPNVVVKWPLQGTTGPHGGAALGLAMGASAQFKAYSGMEPVHIEGPTVMDGRWHHMAGRRVGPMMELWVDGQLAGRVPHNLASVSNAEPLQFGGFGNTTVYDFDGLIDEVALWSRALSPDELAGLAAGASP